MKNLINVLGLSAVICFSGCEGNRSTNNADYDDTERLEADTNAIDGNLNPRGLPEETIPDNSQYSGDTLIHDNPLQKADLPEGIRNEIDKDPNIRNKTITQSRTYSLENQRMYELTFEGEGEIIVFDEKGVRVKRN